MRSFNFGGQKIDFGQMEIQDYIQNKQTIQETLLSFISSDEDFEEYYQNLIKLFNEQKILQNQNELKSFLTLLVKISNNYYRSPTFFSKIERILLHLKNDIQTQFSSSEIFRIFHSNKRILLFIFEEEIISVDDSIIDFMEKDENQSCCYFEYFYFEVEEFLDDEFKNELKNKIKELKSGDYDQFEEKRKLGENDNIICQLIRDDNIDEFISHVNQNCIHLTSLIKPSIYETNLILYKYEITLFEYSAFFGSIQIFKYLYLNGNTFSMQIWPYIVHGKHPEMIHIFEDNFIKLINQEDLVDFINDSIKFHHNEITNYIKSKYCENIDLNNLGSFSQSVKYYNFAFFPNDFKDESIFYYLCRYDHYTLVEILLNTMKFDINQIYI